MQINIEQIPLSAENSFRAYDYDFLSQEQHFHAHAEYELAAVTGVEGVVYCGADTCSFSPGDLFLFGGRLPHRFIPRSEPSGGGKSRGRVVQFRHDALGPHFFQLPENARIRALLKASDEGLVLRREAEGSGTAVQALQELLRAKGAYRLSALMILLAYLADLNEAGKLEILSPGAPDLRTHDADAERLSRLQDYIESEYDGNTSVDGAAELLALTRTSFCRYVKRMTGRTFTELVNDYRLTVAAMMLRDSSPPVSTVAADVGFGSLSHFNSRFKSRFGKTPTEYRDSTVRGQSV
jgi:AraC-like DNA-binding protein